MGLLLPAVQRALKHVPSQPGDEAASELALTYAAEIDGGGDLTKIGPPLLAVLDALGMTPKSRKALVREASGGTASPLDELRQRRAARAAG